jgi:hypothetical protein
MAKDDDGGTGCVLIIASACIGGGIGNIWGAPYGWIAVGACLFLAAVVCVVEQRR